jgi:hypothetical protein
MHFYVFFSSMIAIILATQYASSSPVPISRSEDSKNVEIDNSLKAQEIEQGHDRALYDNEISYNELPIELLQPAPYGAIDEKETIIALRPSIRDPVYMEQLIMRPNTAGEFRESESIPRNEFDEHTHSESDVTAENQSDRLHHHHKRTILNRTPGGVYGRGRVPLGMYPGSEFIPGYNQGMQPGLGNEFLYPHQGSGNFGFGYGGFRYM